MKKFFLFSLCVILATVSALAQETTPCPTNDPLIAEMRDVSIPIGERFRKWEEWARKHYPSQYLKKDYSYYFEELDKLIDAGGLTYSDIRKSIFTIGFYCNAKQQHERHEKYTRFALSLDNPQITLRARHAGTMYNFLMNRSEFAETEAMILKAIGNCTWEVTLHPMLAHFYTLTDQPEKCWKVFGDCAAVNTNFQAVAEIAMARAREQYRLLDEDGARKTLTEAIARLDAAKSPFATTCRLRLASYHPPPEARPIYESILANTAGLVESTERRAPKTLASTQAEALRHFISDSWEQGGVTHFLGNWSDNKAVFDKYFDNVISNRQTGVLQRPLIAARNDAIIYGAYEKALELSARIERINAKEAGSFLFGLYKINALYGCGRHEEAEPLTFALFFATALSISALPVIAKTLMDMGLYRSDLGMVVISVAVFNDLVGWIIFAILLGMMDAGSHANSVGVTIALTLAFAGGGNSLARGMRSARQKGHEIVMQVPLEPFDYPQNDPGPHTLLADQPARDNLEKLYWLLARMGEARVSLPGGCAIGTHAGPNAVVVVYLKKQA